MATKAPAKKAASKAAKKAGTAAKSAGKKPAQKPPKPPKPPKTPPPKKPGRPRGNEVTFTVRVGKDSLTMTYGDNQPQDFDMVLFVKDEEQARRAQDCIDEMGLRKLVVAIAKTYINP